jgi:hypothetical protein
MTAAGWMSVYTWGALEDDGKMTEEFTNLEVSPTCTSSH